MIKCNNCPFHDDCPAPKVTGQGWEGTQPMYYTVPSVADDCPLFRLLAEKQKENDNRND